MHAREEPGLKRPAPHNDNLAARRRARQGRPVLRGPEFAETINNKEAIMPDDNDNNGLGNPGEGNETDSGPGGLNQEGGGGLNLGGSGINGWGDNHSDGMAEYNADHGTDDGGDDAAQVEQSDPTKAESPLANLFQDYMREKVNLDPPKVNYDPAWAMAPYVGAPKDPFSSFRGTASATAPSQAEPESLLSRAWNWAKNEYMTPVPGMSFHEGLEAAAKNWAHKGRPTDQPHPSVETFKTLGDIIQNPDQLYTRFAPSFSERFKEGYDPAKLPDNPNAPLDVLGKGEMVLGPAIGFTTLGMLGPFGVMAEAEDVAEKLLGREIFSRESPEERDRWWMENHD
jgi:hypothetical protein